LLTKVTDSMDVLELEAQISDLGEHPEGIRKKPGKAIEKVIDYLDRGKLRVAEPVDGEWVTHAWIKRAILMYFQRMDSVEIQASAPASGALMFGAAQARHILPSYYDKLPTKRNYKKLGARCVPGGIARYGSYIGSGAILMPGFINIGAYVDDGTMVDTWATVGSCAQIGKNVHLSGGVGIGGVLEPAQASPVIIEDGAFIGSRCIVVEGVHIGKEAVLGAGVVITASTPIIDVRGSEPVIAKGVVGDRCVVIPGSIPKNFPAGEFGVPCALIIGTRTESTDTKTSLNAALREYGVSV
jgi:2,3,4,5-tetrahydropyridine-2-carboxylate N-succinyltransferase